MRIVQDIAFGVTGQTIHFDAPEGRPSSVTSVTITHWDVGDDGDTESAVGSPSVETNPNTTLDDAAGPSTGTPNLLPVTATDGVEVSRLYLLADDDTGESEWVEPIEIADDDYLTLRNPLHNEYTAGSTLKSTRMTATVDSTWVADETNLVDAPGGMPAFRARWVYVVGGKTKVVDTYFNLVRYPGRHGVTPQDVDDAMPGWIDGLPTDHRADQGRRLIDAAHRDVKIDLEASQVDDSNVAHAEIVDVLVVLKTIERTEFARFLAAPELNQERHLAAREKYTHRLQSFVTLTKNVAERDVDGAASVKPALGIYVR